MSIESWELAELIAQMKRAGVKELEAQRGESSIRLSLGRHNRKMVGTRALELAGVERTDAATFVRAPAVGRFSNRHPLGEATTVGDHVQEGDLLGVIAIGPIFRPVIAPVAGRVIEQVCRSESDVEYGTTLYRIMASG
ncbi:MULTISPECIES: acetyl-CoA carboxylase biotin carboxyl carrier protein [Bradyrhizobium]|uniref:Lipoyl-binding domain-containing protein n=3 Tax=Bradyrhizobium TaxID=374 RepID=A0A410VJ83_9BRAD|nr:MULTISPECIES: biotin/lipoyl-containing protein [Bradyrhizobium]MCG2629342.1 hypothetical protein [Bradyrhizobium zhengyangense]MCG2644623.1 hypothetical protein [Bradyrhizobium zhengyangense]MCG2670856.1 hypothetical protein [Bradyrhizobium zhengyangense]MDN4984489.1 hypothetical protein [Bradyrhizobium sp. WYCCWR 13022]MDN5002481.1 hypothetical protein [Bradyrhizobium sp. WYCCWR 12677]